MADLRWGLIGCGDIATKRVAPALRDAPGSSIQAVARAQASKVAEFAAAFGIPEHFEDWRDLVKSPNIDAVYVATPVNQHMDQTVAAAEAGKHVLCEKPMAIDAACCERMIQACADNKVRLGVAYYRRFYPLRKRIVELMHQGVIGKPLVAQIHAFEHFNAKPWEPRAWLLDPEQAGGGPMMDFGSHRIELLLNLFGEANVVRGWKDKLLFEDRGVEDTAGAIFRFKSGVRAQLAVSHAVFEPQDTLRIFGSEGSLRVDVLNGSKLKIVTAEGAHTEEHPPHANVHQPLVEDFVDAVKRGREPAVTGEDGCDVQRLLDQIYAA